MINTTKAITSKSQMKLCSVTPVMMPSSQSTSRITNIVQSIGIISVEVSNFFRAALQPCAYRMKVFKAKYFLNTSQFSVTRIKISGVCFAPVRRYGGGIEVRN
jgi:hypothetical protein